MKSLSPEIHDHIASYFPDDWKTLNALSLTCCIFTSTAQRHLFSKIEVRAMRSSIPNVGTGSQLQRLLLNSPHIAAYIHFLVLVDFSDSPYWFSYEEDTTLKVCLPLLRSLKGLAIDVPFVDSNYDVENVIRGGLLDSHLQPIQLPSITYLDLHQVPPDLLQYCPNLKYLSLSNARTEGHFFKLLDKAKQQGDAKERKRPCLESLRVEHMDFSEDNWIVDNSMLDLKGIKKLHMDAETCFDIGRLMNCFASSLEEIVFYDERGRRANNDDESQLDTDYEEIHIDWSRLTSLKKFSIQVDAEYSYRGYTFAGPPRLYMNAIREIRIPSLEEFSFEIEYRRSILYQHDMPKWIELVRAFFKHQERLPRLRSFHIVCIGKDGDYDVDDMDLELEDELREILHEILGNDVDFRVSVAESRTEFLLAPFSTTLDLD